MLNTIDSLILPPNDTSVDSVDKPQRVYPSTFTSEYKKQPSHSARRSGSRSSYIDQPVLSSCADTLDTHLGGPEQTFCYEPKPVKEPKNLLMMMRKNIPPKPLVSVRAFHTIQTDHAAIDDIEEQRQRNSKLKRALSGTDFSNQHHFLLQTPSGKIQ